MSTTATPVASDSQPHPAVGTSTMLTPTDIVIWARGVADHPRPCRPRPAVWCSAISTAPATSVPDAACASRSALVEPV